jgi:tetratricopeptide (TPR) repeat protein
LDRAKQWRFTLRGLTKGEIPVIPPEVDFSILTVDKLAWNEKDADLRVDGRLAEATVRAFTQGAHIEIDTANDKVGKAIDRLCQEQRQPGIEAEKQKDFAKAVKIFGDTVAKVPHDTDSRHLLQKAKQSRDHLQEYTSGLTSARNSLSTGNLTAAATVIERLRKNSFRDPQLAELEKELRFRIVLKDAQGFVSRGEFRKAREHFKAACALDPNDRDAAAEASAVERIDECQKALTLAEKQIQDERLDSTHQELKSGVDGVFNVSITAIWLKEPYKSLRADLLRKSTSAYRRVCDALKTSSEKAGNDGERLLKTGEFAEAMQQYQNAIGRLERIKIGLRDLQRLGGDTAIKASEFAELEKVIDTYQRSRTSIEVKNLITEGEKGLEYAKRELEKAPSDPMLVGPALKALSNTLSKVRDAEKLDKRAAAAALHEIDVMRKKLECVLRPVELDLDTDLDPLEWTYTKDQWSRPNNGGPPRLQSLPIGPVRMKSANRIWPTDFKLILDFAFVDANGSMSHAGWRDFPEPLAVIVHHANGRKTRISLGADTPITFEPLIRMKVNEEKYTIVNLAAAGRPVRLLLKRREENLEIRLGNQKVVMKTADELLGVSLEINNPRKVDGKKWVVAIYRLDVYWIGLENLKSKSLYKKRDK